MALSEKNSQDLLTDVTKQEVVSQAKLLLKEMLTSQIGDLYFNYDNYHKDKKSFLKLINNVEVEYLLCDGRELNVADYPDLAIAMNIPSSETIFKLPKFLDGTIRHLEVGNERALGSYEEDAMQKIKGRIDSDEESLFGGEIVILDGAFYKGDAEPLKKRSSGVTGNTVASLLFESSKAVDPKDNPVKTDDFETRMKNIAMQIYVKAKIIYNN